MLTCHSGSNCSSLVIFSRSLAEACSDGDVNAVRKLLDEGRSVNEHTEEGESLLCLACSAGYYELAQVCDDRKLQDFRGSNKIYIPKAYGTFK